MWCGCGSGKSRSKLVRSCGGCDRLVCEILIRHAPALHEHLAALLDLLAVAALKSYGMHMHMRLQPLLYPTCTPAITVIPHMHACNHCHTPHVSLQSLSCPTCTPAINVMPYATFHAHGSEITRRHRGRVQPCGLVPRIIVREPMRARSCCS
jgi:hypothetical protein